MSSELDALEIQAGALDTELAQENAIPDPSAGQAEQVAAGNQQLQPLLKQTLGMLVLAASSSYPFVRQHYTPAVVDEIASSIIALCDEYAIDLQSWMGQGGGRMQAWIRLALAAGLPLLGCLAALRQQKQAQAPEPPQGEGSTPPPENTSGKAAQFGAVIPAPAPQAPDTPTDTPAMEG